jgi:superfamily I DNA/RNA helicase
MEESLASVRRVGKPTEWSLSENCRNYEVVGNMAVQLSGLGHDVYSGYMRSGGSLKNYRISFYDQKEKQLEQLAAWLKDFKSQAFRSNEISVLSFHRDDRSAAAALQSRGFRLEPAWKRANGTGYGTVHAFKGLENKVIILTDVLLGEAGFQRYLFYTGMTRATEHLCILCDARSAKTVVDWMQV